MKNSIFSSKNGFSWGGFFAFLVIIAAVVAYSGIANRECSKDSQCGEAKYCGADFSCHAIPTITVQKTEISTDYTTPAAIVGISIVLAALVLKKWQ